MVEILSPLREEGSPLRWEADLMETPREAGEAVESEALRREMAAALDAIIYPLVDYSGNCIDLKVPIPRKDQSRQSQDLLSPDLSPDSASFPRT